MGARGWRMDKLSRVGARPRPRGGAGAPMIEAGINPATTDINEAYCRVGAGN